MSFLLKKFIFKYGYIGLIRIILYPFTIFLKFPLRSIKNYFSLLKWAISNNPNGLFTHLSQGWSYLMLFYYYRADAVLSNKNKFNYLGYGVNKEQFWFYSKISMYLMRFGVKTIIISMLFLQFSLFFILNYSNQGFIIFNTFLIFFSSLAWSIYIRQNYQVIAFSLMPLVLFFHHNDYIIFEMLISLLISTLSISVFVISSFILGVDYFLIGEFQKLSVFIPSTCWFVIKILSGQNTKGKFEDLINITKLIGLSKKDVIYKRETFYFHNYDIFNYLMLILLQISLFPSNGMVFYILALLILYTINKKVRFLDEESIFTSIFIIVLFIFSFYTFDTYSVILITILLNPFPFLIVYPYCKYEFDEIPKVEPFDLRKIYDATSLLLSKLKDNESLLICYSNPNNKYEKLFDGYGYHYIQLIHYIRSKSGAKVLPDWFSIQNDSITNDLQLWGLTKSDIIKNLQKINAKKFLYIDDGRIDCNWLKSSKNFKLISTINTNDYPNSFTGVPWPNENPKFHLYAYNDKSNKVL